MCVRVCMNRIKWCPTPPSIKYKESNFTLFSTTEAILQEGMRLGSGWWRAGVFCVFFKAGKHMHQHLSNCVVMTMHQTNESTLELETLPLSRRVLGQRAVNKKNKIKYAHTHTLGWGGGRLVLKAHSAL